jgi:hypothetical protein
MKAALVLFVVLSASRAEAGPIRNFLSKLRPAGCASGSCAPQSSMPKYRTECNGNVCRRVLVK